MPQSVTDPDDPRLNDYRALTDVELRTRFEPPHGLFVAEGEMVLRRALAAGVRPRSVLTSAKWLYQVANLGLGECPVYLARPDVLESVTGYHVHRGLLASMHRPPPLSVDALIEHAQRLVVLEAINSHTNLGALFRSVAALGMDAVLLSPTCTDPLYRRSVRVSMGEVFALPWARAEQWPDILDRLGERGFVTLALTPDEAAESLAEVDLSNVDRRAVLLGAEGQGLTAGAMAAVGRYVRIPMHHGVDSLNVAAAAAVTFFMVGQPGPAVT